MNKTTGTITGVKKLIILDYRNAVVVILPVMPPEYGIIEAQQVEEWCRNNQTNLKDCSWMVWDGYVRYGE